MKQRTEEWHAARLGKVTASRAGDIFSTRIGNANNRTRYMSELLAERLTGIPSKIPTTGPMQWGIDHEEAGLALYSFMYGVEVEKCGFIEHPEIKNSGASPDGLVEETGLVEIKCPNTVTHLQFLNNQRIPHKHYAQMLWQLACTGRQWCDYASYDPRLPFEQQLVVKRVSCDAKEIHNCEVAVRSFLTQLENLETKARGYKLVAEPETEKDE